MSATVPGVAPPAKGLADEIRLPRVLLPNVAELVDRNATVPDGPPSENGPAFPPTKRMNTNMTVPGVGAGDGANAGAAPGAGLGMGLTAAPRGPQPTSLRSVTEPLPLTLGPDGRPVARLEMGGMATALGMPAPSSDPFVENALTAPAPVTPKSGAPSAAAAGRILAPPPDPEDLVRGLERDRSVQTPIAHVAESRGRDGASHAVIALPAQGQAQRPIEPLVVVDVGTDPTSRSVTAVVATPLPLPVAISEAPRGVPRRPKARALILLCIFGVCLMLAVGIIGTLAAKYLPGTEPAAGEPSARATLRPAARAPTVAAPVLTAPAAVPSGSAASASTAASAAAAAGGAVSAPPSETADPAPSARAPASRGNGSRPAAKPARSANPQGGNHANELERGID